MKKEYTTPVIDIKEFSSNDIITASGLTDGVKQTTFKKFKGDTFTDIKY